MITILEFKLFCTNLVRSWSTAWIAILVGHIHFLIYTNGITDTVPRTKNAFLYPNMKGIFPNIDTTV